MDLQDLFNRQKAFHARGETLPLAFRLDALARLEKTVESGETAIRDALAADLGRPAFEAYGADTGVVLEEIRFARKHLKSWAAVRKTRTPLISFPSRSTVRPEPLGVALIISPWNFPFLLAFAPLTGAVAAGNCAILKPSSQAPASSALIARMVEQVFDPGHVAVVSGDRRENEGLLELPFDKIYLTGSTQTAKSVMRAAAENLTPLTLELGGKNPCIVDETADLALSAKRILWGKCFNAGQSCVAPDHLWVHSSVKELLVAELKKNILLSFGPDPAKSPDFGRIVNASHFKRLSNLLRKGRILCGGERDEGQRYIAPTLLDGVTADDPIMQEEIFGPILPVLEYDRVEPLIEKLKTGPRPLALYVFSGNDSFRERLISEVPFGGGCVNDVIFQFVGPHLPFGGVGASGMGRAHGKATFDAFSNYKSMLANTFLFDFPVRYPPFGNKLPLLRKILGEKLFGKKKPRP